MPSNQAFSTNPSKNHDAFLTPNKKGLQAKPATQTITYRFIILPITKNNTSRVVPINGTLYKILSRSQGMCLGTGMVGTSGTLSAASTRLAVRRASVILGFTI
jgi:hypothetical protein